MSNKITIKRSSVTGKVPEPGDLDYGEFALNYTDGNLFFKSNANVITNLASTQFVSVTGNVTGSNIVSNGCVYGVELWSTNSNGDEGGQINLSQAASNSTLSGDSVTVDIWQNRFRIFEQGGDARGAFIDISACAPGVGTNLLTGGGGGTPGGADTQIQFNDGGVFGGSAGLTFNKTTNALATSGTVVSTGNITGGNLITAGAVSGNGRALTSLSATNIDTGTLAQARLANANVVLGNTTVTLGATVTTVTGLSSVTSTTFVGALTGAATTAGTVTTAAQPNITSVGTLSSVSVSGNIVGGNISTAGLITATGNVTGNYFIGNGSQLTGIQAGAVTTFSSSPPSSPSQGDVWIDADTGIQYIYFNDGSSSQWAEMEAQTSFSSGSGGGGDVSKARLTGYSLVFGG